MGGRRIKREKDIKTSLHPLRSGLGCRELRRFINSNKETIMNTRQSKKNLKNSLLSLPDGSVLKKSAVVVMEKRKALPEQKLGPAVIFIFQFGDRGEV